MNKDIQNHFFWKYALGKHRIFELINEQVNANIVFSVRLFYGLLLMWSYHSFLNIDMLSKKALSNPVWVVYYTKIFPKFSWIYLFIIILFVSSCIIQFKYKRRLFRILIFSSFLILSALLNSTGKISHNLHVLLIPLFCFIFLDFSSFNNKTIQKNNSLIFASAIFTLLCSYTLSGFWKIVRGVYQSIIGEVSVFSISSMSYHLQNQFKYSNLPEIALFFCENEWLGFLFLWLGILIELFSVFVFFNKRMHSIWGVFLLLLHIGIYLVMDITYRESIIVILPLLLLSPFGTVNKDTTEIV